MYQYLVMTAYRRKLFFFFFQKILNFNKNVTFEQIQSERINNSLTKDSRNSIFAPVPHSQILRGTFGPGSVRHRLTPCWAWWRWAHAPTGQKPSTRTDPACQGSSPGWRSAGWPGWRSAGGWVSRPRPLPRPQNPSRFFELDTHWKINIIKLLEKLKVVLDSRNNERLTTSTDAGCPPRRSSWRRLYSEVNVSPARWLICEPKSIKMNFSFWTFQSLQQRCVSLKHQMKLVESFMICTDLIHDDFTMMQLKGK